LRGEANVCRGEEALSTFGGEEINSVLLNGAGATRLSGMALLGDLRKVVMQKSRNRQPSV
jgi:hypothetical protein